MTEEQLLCVLIGVVQNDRFYLITLLTVRLDEGAKAHADSTQMKNSRMVALNILRDFYSLSGVFYFI